MLLYLPRVDDSTSRAISHAFSFGGSISTVISSDHFGISKFRTTCSHSSLVDCLLKGYWLRYFSANSPKMRSVTSDLATRRDFLDLVRSKRATTSVYADDERADGHDLSGSTIDQRVARLRDVAVRDGIGSRQVQFVSTTCAGQLARKTYGECDRRIARLSREISLAWLAG